MARAATTELTWDELGYPDAAGLPRLRRQLAAYLARGRGAQVEPGQLVVCAGTLDAVMRLRRGLRTAGHTHVAVEDPGWTQLHLTVAAAGLTPVAIPVDEDGLRVDLLHQATAARAVIVAPAHQFPTGVVLAPARRAELADWAREVDGLVMEDDYDASSATTAIPWATCRGPRRTMSPCSVRSSKTLSPAVRLGWIAAPERWTDALTARDTGGTPPPVIDQDAFTRFVASGSYDRHLRASRLRYKRGRDHLLRELAARLPGQAVGGATAGFHLLLPLTDCPAGAVVEEAARADVRLASLDDYRLTPTEADASTLVFGYGNLTDQAVPGAVQRLTHAIERVRAGEHGAQVRPLALVGPAAALSPPPAPPSPDPSAPPASCGRAPCAPGPPRGPPRAPAAPAPSPGRSAPPRTRASESTPRPPAPPRPPGRGGPPPGPPPTAARRLREQGLRPRSAPRGAPPTPHPQRRYSASAALWRSACSCSWWARQALAVPGTGSAPEVATSARRRASATGLRRGARRSTPLGLPEAPRRPAHTAAAQRQRSTRRTGSASPCRGAPGPPGAADLRPRRRSSSPRGAPRSARRRRRPAPAPAQDARAAAPHRAVLLGPSPATSLRQPGRLRRQLLRQPLQPLGLRERRGPLGRPGRHRTVHLVRSVTTPPHADHVERRHRSSTHRLEALRHMPPYGHTDIWTRGHTRVPPRYVKDAAIGAGSRNRSGAFRTESDRRHTPGTPRGTRVPRALDAPERGRTRVRATPTPLISTGPASAETAGGWA
ncbi:hypothetical protein SMICM304S_10378 [Streptomyces microflavus]